MNSQNKSNFYSEITIGEPYRNAVLNQSFSGVEVELNRKNSVASPEILDLKVASGNRNNQNYKTALSTPKMKNSSFVKDFNATVVAFSPSEVKPKLLEGKFTETQNFYKLSDNFKNIFANDKEDQRIVLPISGYGGHRRGDRSQNFFGRPFREITI